MADVDPILIIVILTLEKRVILLYIFYGGPKREIVGIIEKLVDTPE